MNYMSTDFGATSSSRFPLRAWTNRQTDRRDWTPYPTPATIQPAWVKRTSLVTDRSRMGAN